MLEPLYDWVALEEVTEKVPFKRPIRKSRTIELPEYSRWEKVKAVLLNRNLPIEKIEYYYEDEEYEESRFAYFKVIAVGPGDRREGQFIKPHVKIGDKIPGGPKSWNTSFDHFDIKHVGVGDDIYWMTRERDLLAVIREEEK